MKINGIENFDEVKQEIIKKIIKHEEDFGRKYEEEIEVSKDLDVEEVVDIDGNSYYIIPEDDEYTYLDNMAENLFDNSIDEVPDHWQEYIDRDRWIADNTYDDFGIFLEEEYGYLDPVYLDNFNGYNVYSL